MAMNVSALFGALGLLVLTRSAAGEATGGASDPANPQVRLALSSPSPSGLFNTPVPCRLAAAPGTTCYFTTNGSIPSPQNGSMGGDSLSISNTTILRIARFKDGLISG